MDFNTIEVEDRSVIHGVPQLQFGSVHFTGEVEMRPEIEGSDVFFIVVEAVNRRAYWLNDGRGFVRDQCFALGPNAIIVLNVSPVGAQVATRPIVTPGGIEAKEGFSYGRNRSNQFHTKNNVGTA